MHFKTRKICCFGICLSITASLFMSGCGSSGQESAAPFSDTTETMTSTGETVFSTETNTSDGTETLESNIVESTSFTMYPVETFDTFTIPDCTADFLNQITVGWNLGNSLDSCVSGEYRNLDGRQETSFYETAWGNPVVTKELIDSVYEAGFNTIRIPVTWYYNTYIDQNGVLQIQEGWIDRVREVVDYCMDKDMFVILNSHHEGEIIYASTADFGIVSQRAEELWESIADSFSEYDNRLIFEGYNEINDETDSWDPTQENVEINNALNQIFVDTVRNSGGNNANRLLMIGTYLNLYDSIETNGFVLPKDTVDDHLMIDVHCYEDAFDQELEKTFDSLVAFSEQAGAPVVIGEFGTTSTYTPEGYRSIHAGNYIARANEHLIKCIWWDNGSSDKFAIFDRKTNTISEPDIVSALMNPVAKDTEYTQDVTISTVSDFVYQTIDRKNGDLIDSDAGAVTYTAGGTGFAVTPGLHYSVSLSIKDRGDGMRLAQIAFYDDQDAFLETMVLDSALGCDVQAPDHAAYMRVVLYNPWGARSWNEYKSMFQKKDLCLLIKEYLK